MWIKCNSCSAELVDTDSLRNVRVLYSDSPFGGSDSHWVLRGYFQGLGNKRGVVIDQYVSEDEAREALDWLGRLLSCRISQSSWEAGRHSVEYREGENI